MNNRLAKVSIKIVPRKYNHKGENEMAKADIKEKHSKSIDGILDTDEMTIDCENLGKLKLSDLLIKFNGEKIKLNVNLTNEVTD